MLKKGLLVLLAVLLNGCAFLNDQVKPGLKALDRQVVSVVSVGNNLVDHPDQVTAEEKTRFKETLSVVRESSYALNALVGNEGYDFWRAIQWTGAK